MRLKANNWLCLIIVLLLVSGCRISTNYVIMPDCGNEAFAALEKLLKGPQLRARAITIAPHNEKPTATCEGVFRVGLDKWNVKEPTSNRFLFIVVSIGGHVYYNLAYTYGEPNELGFPDTVEEDLLTIKAQAQGVYSDEELEEIEYYFRKGLFKFPTGRIPF